MLLLLSVLFPVWQCGVTPISRLRTLEKDIHILLIVHRKTIKFDFDRLITRPDAAALFGCSIRHLDRILAQCHVMKVHMPGSRQDGGNTSFIRWGDLVDNIFVRQYYDIPERKNGTGYRYCDDFERAYAEFWSERKKDLK